MVVTRGQNLPGSPKNLQGLTSLVMPIPRKQHNLTWYFSRLQFTLKPPHGFKNGRHLRLLWSANQYPLVCYAMLPNVVAISYRPLACDKEGSRSVTGQKALWTCRPRQAAGCNGHWVIVANTVKGGIGRPTMQRRSPPIHLPA